MAEDVLNTKQAFDYWNKVEAEYLKTIKFIPQRPFRTPRELQIWIWKEIFQETKRFNVDEFISSLQIVKKMWETKDTTTTLTEDEQNDNKALTHFFEHEEVSQQKQVVSLTPEEIDTMPISEVNDRKEQLKELQQELQSLEIEIKKREDVVRERESAVLMCEVHFEEKSEELTRVTQQVKDAEDKLKALKKELDTTEKSLTSKMKDIKTKETDIQTKEKQVEEDGKILKIQIDEVQKIIARPGSLSRGLSMDLSNYATLTASAHNSNRTTPNLTPRLTRVMAQKEGEKKNFKIGKMRSPQSLDEKEKNEILQRSELFESKKEGELLNERGESTVERKERRDSEVGLKVRELMNQNFAQMVEITQLRDELEDSKQQCVRLSEAINTEDVLTKTKLKRELTDEEIDEFVGVFLNILSNKQKETRGILALAIYDSVKLDLPRSPNLNLRKSLNVKKKFQYSSQRPKSIGNEEIVNCGNKEVMMEDLYMTINQFRNDEYVYFRQLLEFFEIYIKAIKCVNKYIDFAKNIGGMLEKMMALSRNILRSVEKLVLENNVVTIGDILKPLIQDFEIYTLYFGGYQLFSKSFPQVEEDLEINKQVVLNISVYVNTQREIQKENFVPPVIDNPQSYLHLPITRLEEYLHFCKTTKKCLKTSQKDFTVVTECEEFLERIFTSATNLLRSTKSSNNVMTVEKSLRKSTGPLAIKRRKLVYFGLLIPIGDVFGAEKSIPRMCVLMNNLLLIAKVKMFKGLKVDDGYITRKFTGEQEWSIDDISEMTLIEEFRMGLTPPVTSLVVIDDKLKNVFLIIQNDVKLHLLAATEKNREKWMKYIDGL
ncbi:hypothetical protein EIN_274650 [Entamoeba invadens IP1]|uniref:DH domain-containing protein n=1 Tax=Entamoeba invadens IP1 TaxID=370355 RepID=A0A0A1U4Q9_ENTIV|nr:hypothetical protein EIN_274650 [Entamoeba invadens IP1]ELP87878.1 hypothetical protein EIN_274650 [Entamoeba invadens IP1]|eukprot:XP_004254649.1 hypothetical protein EIN_274650 [Entamoeba invadens IP1]